MSYGFLGGWKVNKDERYLACSESSQEPCFRDRCSMKKDSS